MPRKRRSSEEIIKIIREADSGVAVPEICKRHGISNVTYNRWREKYGGMDVSDSRRLKELEKQNADLKKLAGSQALIIEGFKEELKKRGWG